MEYIVKVPKEKMQLVSDMLRYDGCFRVVEETGDIYRCGLLHFTQDRWASFGFVPSLVHTLKMTARFDHEHSLRAMGFTAGIRFAQKLLGQRLIEG